MKYKIVKHEIKDYYYVWNLTKNKQVCDEDGNPCRFGTMKEAEQFVNELGDNDEQ